MAKVVLFWNRRAGSIERPTLMRKLIGQLRDLRFHVEVIEEFAALEEQFHNNVPPDLAPVGVIVAGGDGTVEAVANRVPAETPIAVLPMGTENLLARYLGSGRDPQRLARMVARGRTKRFDAGKANGKLFLLMLSCGFDADVVRRLHDSRQGNITHLSYAQPIMDAVWQYDYPLLKVEWTADPARPARRWESSECRWAFIFNMPAYAGGLKIAPQSDPADGLLELATFDGGSFWHGLLQLSAVVIGQQHQLPGFQLRSIRALRISSDESEVPFQVDGDPGGQLPVEIEVVPEALNLFVDE